MTASREDLRDHLSAVIEAARELPKEDRSFLADNFLEELEKQSQLVPRSMATRQSAPRPARPGFPGFATSWRPGRLVLMVLLGLLLLPVLMGSLFVLIHPPVLLLALVLFVLFRFGRPGMRHGGPWGNGHRRGNAPHSHL